MPVTTRSMAKKQQNNLNNSEMKNQQNQKKLSYYKYEKSFVDNSDIISDGVYIATSEEGDVFRIIFTEENEKHETDPLYKNMKGLECYDESYIRYIYYSDTSNLKTSSFGTLYTKYHNGEECFWNVTLKKEMEPVIVDKYNHLFIYDSNINDYVDWRSVIDEYEFGEMVNEYDDESYYNFITSYNYFDIVKYYEVNVINLKKNKKTGNYRMLINIYENSGNNKYDKYDNANYCVVIISPTGKILCHSRFCN